MAVLCSKTITKNAKSTDKTVSALSSSLMPKLAVSQISDWYIGHLTRTNIRKIKKGRGCDPFPWGQTILLS
jgi:hypothetical protein